MKTYFISDLHLGHANCIRFDKRPWETAEEMDMEIIRRWNRKVRKEDHVYVLGDFAYRNRTTIADYTKQMNGHIHLIRGNHDKRSEAYESCFYEVVDYKDMVIMADGVKCRLILSHYFIPFYGNPFLYQKMGFIASQYRNELNISDEFINICKQRKGSSKRYLVNDISEPAYARDWSLVYPKHIKEMKNGVMDDAAN